MGMSAYGDLAEKYDVLKKRLELAEEQIVRVTVECRSWKKTASELKKVEQERDNLRSRAEAAMKTALTEEARAEKYQRALQGVIDAVEAGRGPWAVGEARAALADPNLGADWVPRTELERTEKELAQATESLYVQENAHQAELRRVAEAVRERCARRARDYDFACEDGIRAVDLDAIIGQPAQVDDGRVMRVAEAVKSACWGAAAPHLDGWSARIAVAQVDTPHDCARCQVIHTEKEIREAFFRIHDYASGRSAKSYMSIPADPRRDADLILADAIDELIILRKLVTDLACVANKALVEVKQLNQSLNLEAIRLGDQ